MTADVEDEYIVCQATEPLDENGDLVNDARHLPSPRRDSSRSTASDVDLMDVSPQHDDLGRDRVSSRSSRTTTQTAH